MQIHSYAPRLIEQVRAALPAASDLTWLVCFTRAASLDWVATIFLASAFDPFDPSDPDPIAVAASVSLSIPGNEYRLDVCGDEALVWVGDPTYSSLAKEVALELVSEVMARVRECS